MDYRKLNKETKKEHFPLLFTNYMLDQLAGHDYFYFLDGYFGYNQIVIALEDHIYLSLLYFRILSDTVWVYEDYLFENGGEKH